MSTPSLLGRIRSALGRPSPGSNTLPLQYSPLTPDHFKTPEGVAFFNLQFQQVVDAINAGNGALGRVTLPYGVDVRGATVTGLGAPSSPSDAVSLAHANGQFSPQVQQPQLDLGGKYALKGLTGLQINFNKLQTQADGTSGSGAAGFYSQDSTGLIRQWNSNVSVPGSLAITFPIPFTELDSISIVAVEVYVSGSTHYPNINSGWTVNGFTAGISDAATSLINWFACGY